MLLQEDFTKLLLIKKIYFYNANIHQDSDILRKESSVRDFLDRDEKKLLYNYSSKNNEVDNQLVELGVLTDKKHKYGTGSLRQALECQSPTKLKRDYHSSGPLNKLVKNDPVEIEASDSVMIRKASTQQHSKLKEDPNSKKQDGHFIDSLDSSVPMCFQPDRIQRL